MLITILYVGNNEWSWVVKINNSHCAGIANSHKQAWAQVNEFVGGEKPREPCGHPVRIFRVV